MTKSDAISKQPVRHHEAADVAQGEGNFLIVLFPGIEADLGVRRQQRRLHRRRVGVRGDVVWQNQHRCWAIPHKVAVDGEDEIRPLRVHVVEEFRGHLHSDLGPPLDELGRPAVDVVVVVDVRMAGDIAAWVHQCGGGNPVTRLFQQVPDHRAADAKAQHHEPVNVEVVHQAELVVGEAVPGPVDLQWALRPAIFGVAQVQGDDAIGIAEFLQGIEGMTGEPGYGCIETAAGNDQQRKAGAGLLVVNFHISVFEYWHNRISLTRGVFLASVRVVPVSPE